MKPFFVLTFCLTLAFTARAADDNHKKKHADEQPAPAQHAQKQGVVKPSKHHGPNAGVQGNTGIQSNNPNLNKHGHGLKNQDNHLPAVQSNAQVHNGKEKFHIKKFETKKGPDSAIATEKFKEGKHLEGSEKWEGKKYTAFKLYKAERHDRDWWRHHHTRIILISGGWYFWNTGYWCPAWGYDDAYSYYPYDGPIYAANDLPPDQVIANVQSALQSQGYYQGEVDGLLGPLTRAALAQYQADHGLYTTSAIDEPTLESLGMV